MEQAGIPTHILITAIGVVILIAFLLFSLASYYLRFRVRSEGAHGRFAEHAPVATATPAPAGSMAERRHNIEELLQRKERESQDS
jgi:hypothetical protein